MSSPFVRLGGWTITGWTTNDAVTENGVPTNGVQHNSQLDIAPAPTATSETLRFLWLDQNGNPCSVSGLLPDPLAPMPMLFGEELNVSFGNKNVTCRITVTLDQATDSDSLTCVFALPPEKVRGMSGPDAGSGTFTATASPGTGNFRKH